MKKTALKIILFIGIFALFGYFIAKNIPVILNTYETTASNITGYLLLAAILMFGARWSIGLMLKECFDVVGMKRTGKEMFSLELQALAVNLIIPTAGASVAVLFADDAQKRGESRTKAVNGGILTYLVDYTAISFLLLLAIIFLYFIKSLTPTVIIPAVIFFFLTGGLYFLSFAAAKKADFLENMLKKFSRAVITPLLRLFKKEVDLSDSVEKLVREISEANEAALRDPKNILRALRWSLLAHFLRLVIIYIIFVSLGLHPLYRVVLAGYAIGALFVVVSPTPNGVGFVEGSMALVFSGLGIPGAVATTTTIIYRALDFWIPFSIGFFLLQRANIRRIRDEMFGKS
jgi:uncharacterized protein (TIRG00374 family)